MIRTEPLRQWVLWAFLAVSAFAAIEPSPYEFMFGVAVLVFVGGGLRFDKAMAPLIVTLAVWNAGGLLSLTPFVDERESVTFIAITIYISLTTIFFAAVVADAPSERMAVIRSGYMFAAILAATLGIFGYFDIAGLGPYFTLYDNSRAMGPFKDPNVFGPFLVPPIVWLCQDVLLRRGHFVAATAKLVVLLIGLFLSFSRGAMVDGVASLAMLLGLTFLTAPSARLRGRTVMIAVLGALLVACLLAIVLAIPNVRDMALSRASLAQDYDVGEEGRFGNQIRSIPMLLDRPFGFGPLRFSHIFPQDPHEVFLSAFASFGWLGGLAFLTFVGVTLYLGWALSFRRSPLQPQIIALWSSLFPQVLQGVQIDTSHWRHLFLMVGCLYGFAAAERVQRIRWTSAPNLPRRRSRAGAEIGV
ncbi:MAG: O-antigen ligase family protein [Roseiarcus sp.]|jgi:hypothetical protein